MKKNMFLIALMFLITSTMCAQGLLTPKGESSVNINTGIARYQDVNTFGAGLSFMSKQALEIGFVFSDNSQEGITSFGMGLGIHFKRSEAKSPFGMALNFKAYRVNGGGISIGALAIGPDFYANLRIS
jgi:hypothetical protein